MRVLIIGASGLIGSHILREAAGRGMETIGTARQAAGGLAGLDITDHAAVTACLDQTRPDAVIAPVAQPNVEYCEDHPDETQQLNVDAIAHVLQETARRDVPFVFFSSDYVFDGRSGPYREDDPVHPLSVYGRQKAACEALARQIHPRHLMIRTTGVYGQEPAGKNFVAALLRRLRAGETVPVPADQFGSPTEAGDLARAVVRLVERGATGTYHVSGPEVLARAAFAALVAEVFGLDAARITPVPTAALGQHAARPLRGGLRIDKLEGETGVGMRPPRQALEALSSAL